MLLTPDQRTLLERAGMDKVKALNGILNGEAVVNRSGKMNVSQEPFFEPVLEDC